MGGGKPRGEKRTAKRKGLRPMLYVVRPTFIERQQIGWAVLSAAQSVQFTIPAHKHTPASTHGRTNGRSVGRHPSTRGGYASVVPCQIEKITFSRPHFNGRIERARDREGEGDGGNESEELEIDVTAVARNDSRFVASSCFIARKKKKRERKEGRKKEKRGTQSCGARTRTAHENKCISDGARRKETGWANCTRAP